MGNAGWLGSLSARPGRRARDELFAREIVDSILEAKVVYEDWRQAYNRHRPHSALGLQPPEVFAKTFNNPKLSLPLA